MTSLAKKTVEFPFALSVAKITRFINKKATQVS